MKRTTAVTVFISSALGAAVGALIANAVFYGNLFHAFVGSYCLVALVIHCITSGSDEKEVS